MNHKSTCTIASAAMLSVAAAASATTYYDSVFDTFDNGLANLDIVAADVQYTSGMLVMSVTTRGFSDWTKYMIFLDVAPGGSSSNPWNRPINLGTAQADFFIGSWVDQPTNNTQLWGYGMFGAAQWDQLGAGSALINSAYNTVTWAMQVDLAPGSSIRFDVATSGGGNDPGVDHLSNLGLATSGWGSPSQAGEFLTFTTVPAPGALALLGVAGVLTARRRR
ncbi:MAG: PEP-CTERM sorting domain-containing protein [Phycisphaerales bacterium]|nr:PEP-CTERM sorting domain-containing protein [Phycisphaerales bacterium]